jgi:hypothetical protein
VLRVSKPLAAGCSYDELLIEPGAKGTERGVSARQEKKAPEKKKLRLLLTGTLCNDTFINFACLR